MCGLGCVAWEPALATCRRVPRPNNPDHTTGISGLCMTRPPQPRPPPPTRNLPRPFDRRRQWWRGVNTDHRRCALGLGAIILRCQCVWIRRRGCERGSPGDSREGTILHSSLTPAPRPPRAPVPPPAPIPRAFYPIPRPGPRASARPHCSKFKQQIHSCSTMGFLLFIIQWPSHKRKRLPPR